MVRIAQLPPGTPEPDIQPPPGPELDPAGAPDEMPPLQPGYGDPGDFRPYGKR